MDDVEQPKGLDHDLNGYGHLYKHKEQYTAPWSISTGILNLQCRETLSELLFHFPWASKMVINFVHVFSLFKVARSFSVKTATNLDTSPRSRGSGLDHRFVNPQQDIHNIERW